MRQSIRNSVLGLSMGVCVLGAMAVSAAAQQLPDPDGKAADMSKPVKVFILLGQSNMLGAGKVSPEEKAGSLLNAVKTESLYPFLVNDAGEWTERQDVRNVRVMVGRGGGMRLFNNEWMTVKGGKIGPELGIGHQLGNLLDEPVMILKSCIGNRSLGWDLLPPGSAQFEEDGKIYAGYKESPLSWDKGTEPQKIGWYAGKQYDDDIANGRWLLLVAGRQGSLQCRPCGPLRAEPRSADRSVTQGLRCAYRQVCHRHIGADRERR
jgi:hypothetical protein